MLKWLEEGRDLSLAERVRVGTLDSHRTLDIPYAFLVALGLDSLSAITIEEP